MVGGEDYDRSEFNRVSQACRQPGSVYKPMYYSLALDRGYGFSSLLNDVPRAEVDPVTGEQRDVPTADRRLRERYAAAAAEQRADIAAAIRRAGADHLILRTDRDWLLDVVRFVASRRQRVSARRAGSAAR